LDAPPQRFDSSCNVCSSASRRLPAHSTGVKRLPAVLCSHLVHALYPSNVLEKRLPLSLSVRGGLRVQDLQGFGVQGSDLLPLSLSAPGGFGDQGSGLRSSDFLLLSQSARVGTFVGRGSILKNPCEGIRFAMIRNPDE